MEQSNRLATLFLSHASKRVTTPTDPAALGALLHHAWEKAQGPWPGVSLSDEDFVIQLAHRLTAAGVAGPLTELLDQWHLSDLYLACACMKEVPAAREALRASYLSKVATWLGNHSPSADALSEIRQTLLINLLMGTAKAGPRLATYNGKGPLETWIRVSAVRIAIRQGAVPREHHAESARELSEAIPAQQPEAELDLIRRRYGPEFRQVYRESLRALPDDQKLLLQMYFIERLPTTRLGALFGVEPSTIWRRLKSAREVVYEETKRRLKERLHLSSHDFESLLAAIRSQLDESISQILEEDDDD